MRERCALQKQLVDVENQEIKVKNKQPYEVDRGIVDRRSQIFACRSRDEPKMERTDQWETKAEQTCYGKMDRSLQLLKSEMVELACLNVQLMEKMMEMQGQIECIKKERADIMLELFKSEQFERKIENLSASSLCSENKSKGILEEGDKDCYSSDSPFTKVRASSSSEKSLPNRKSTIDSLSSLPSLSSIQSESSCSAFETENEDIFGNENETACSDSGVDVQYEAVELDFFLSAATTDV